ncbi:helix-turn-helix domain-containing protein [Nonomuraea sp. NPDC050394]|uniref:helix-turn-helix domain-containing protein n=1 Tax=Nonomuraea sp. NPDC050394 TaxID=3364363 RepID=UPI0037BD00F5
MKRGRDIARAGEFVASRRGELDLTQQELAETAGVDVKTIYNLESGSRWPQAGTRAAIEKALHMQPGQLQRVSEERATDPVLTVVRPVAAVETVKRWFAAELDRRGLGAVELVAPLDTLRAMADANRMTLGELLVESGLANAEELMVRPASGAGSGPVEEFRREFERIKASPFLSRSERRALEEQYQEIMKSRGESSGDG